MKEYSLSVIIPNYNNEKYISQCIDSILEQSYKPTEIIVVDDCSTDSSKEIIKKYEEQYDIVKGVYLEENKGVSHARNMGLEYAKSSYVSFTDGDDFYFSKDKLKNEMELIQRFSKKGKDVVIYSQFVLVNEDGQVIRLPKLSKWRFMKGYVFTDLLALSKFGALPRDFCVSKELVCAVGRYCFEEDFYEDLDLLFRLSQKAKFYPTYNYGVAYRQKESGLSRRPAEEHIRAKRQIVNNYLQECSFFVKAKVLIKGVTEHFLGWFVKKVKTIL